MDISGALHSPFVLSYPASSNQSVSLRPSLYHTGLGSQMLSDTAFQSVIHFPFLQLSSFPIFQQDP